MKLSLSAFVLFSVASADSHLRGRRQLHAFDCSSYNSERGTDFCCCKNKNTIGQEFDNYLIEDHGKTKCAPAGYVEDGGEIGAGLDLGETMKTGCR